MLRAPCRPALRALHGKSIQRSVRRQTYSQLIVVVRLLVQDGAPHLGDLPLAELLDERERRARVGDVVGDQDARLGEVDEVRDRRQDHRHLEALVDARVELDVHRERVLDAERVGERPGDEQAAARDREHHVGPVAVVHDPLCELARADAQVLPRHDLARAVDRSTIDEQWVRRGRLAIAYRRRPLRDGRGLSCVRMSEAILVVDDDAPIRRMLERTLVAEGYQVIAAADGGAALAAIERSVPDLLVLDIGMPGVDGLAVCRRARARGLATPILLLTARDAVSDRVDGLDAGADDYLVKPFATEELLARVRALLRRGREPAELLACGDLVFEVATRTARRQGREIALSEREADLLELLLRNQRQVVTRETALCAGLGQRARRELEQRRPLRLVSAPEARRALVDRDRARLGLRSRTLSVRSLLGRSVLAAVGGIVLAIVVVGAGVDVLASRDLHRSLDRSLRQRAVEISQLSASAPALLTRPGALDTTLGGTQLRVEVLDRRNRLVARSLSLGGRVLPARRLAAQAIASGRSAYATTSAGGERLRLYAAPLADFGGPAAGGAVVVAASEQDMDRTLGNLHLAFSSSPGS